MSKTSPNPPMLRSCSHSPALALGTTAGFIELCMVALARSVFGTRKWHLECAPVLVWRI